MCTKFGLPTEAGEEALQLSRRTYPQKNGESCEGVAGGRAIARGEGRA